MNFYNFIFDYFSKDHLEKFLLKENPNLDKTNLNLKEIQKLIQEIDKINLQKIFSKQDLLNLCEKLTLPTFGKKNQLWQYISLSNKFSFEKKNRYKDPEIISLITALEEKLMNDLSSWAFKFLIFGSYSKDRALQIAMRKYPKKKFEEISNSFEYVLQCLKEIRIALDAQIGIPYEIDSRSSDEMLPFEEDIANKFSRIPKETIFIYFNNIYVWDHLK